MTTLKDYARDLIIDAQKALNDKYFPVELPEDQEKKDAEQKELTEYEIDDLVEEFLANIKIRLIGE